MQFFPCFQEMFIFYMRDIFETTYLNIILRFNGIINGFVFSYVLVFFNTIKLFLF